MARYIANAYLTHRGALVKTGEKLDLTDKQAERLGDKVTKLSEATEEQKAEAEARVASANITSDAAAQNNPADSAGDKTVKELRAEAKEYGITGYSNMDKSELTAALEQYHADNA